MLVSAIQQSESAMCIHTSPPTSLPLGSSQWTELSALEQFPTIYLFFFNIQKVSSWLTNHRLFRKLTRSVNLPLRNIQHCIKFLGLPITSENHPLSPGPEGKQRKWESGDQSSIISYPQGREGESSQDWRGEGLRILPFLSLCWWQEDVHFSNCHGAEHFFFLLHCATRRVLVP